MFQFKNGRLYPDITPRRLSFKIPDGFWFVTNPEDLSEDCIRLTSEDKKLMIEIGVEVGNHLEDGTAIELEEIFDSCPQEEIEGPFSISINEGTDHSYSGHCIYYLGYEQQYVIRLDVGRHGFLGWLTDEQDANDEDDWVDRLYIDVTVDAYRGKSMEEAKKALLAAIQDPGLQELIESIRMEPRK